MRELMHPIRGRVWNKCYCGSERQRATIQQAVSRLNSKLAEARSVKTREVAQLPHFETRGDYVHRIWHL